MFELYTIIEMLLLGLFVGFISGLFGIGGGGVIVPILTTIFLSQGFEQSHVVHMALGTSMAIMAITSISSVIAQNKKGAVVWSVFKMILPGVILGSFLATFIANYLSSFYLAIFFSIFMLLSSIHMFFGKPPKSVSTVFSFKTQVLSGSVIGSISALVSIAGGILSVPYLALQGIDMKKAIATSSAIGLPLAFAGAIGYMINGWSGEIETKGLMIGHVSLSALLVVAVASYLAAPLGVRFSHSLPMGILKKLFSLLPLILSIKMMLSVT